jgi:hypothetical protein
MKNLRSLSLGCFALIASALEAFGQTTPLCKDGACRVINLSPLQEAVLIDDTTIQAAELAVEDRFDQIAKATVRVTVSGVCGSGTIVGRDTNENALVLTNAHVAGSQRGRVVNVERWSTNGSSERGQGTIIAAGYGRGMSVDFALLRCNGEFAKEVIPIPIANRYPAVDSTVTTYGCPRCEWPSLQILKMNRRDGQILTWRPEAIGGRSGSSVVEHTESGPRVVGLLTWGGNGEGLGQSSPFLLEAMKGRLPTSLESLPPGVAEVNGARADSIFIATYPIQETATEEARHDPLDDDTLDRITEPKEPTLLRPRPNPDDPGNTVRPREGIFAPISRWFRDRVLVLALMAISLIAGFFGGLWFSKNRGGLL